MVAVSVGGLAPDELWGLGPRAVGGVLQAFGPTPKTLTHSLTFWELGMKFEAWDGGRSGMET